MTNSGGAWPWADLQGWVVKLPKRAKLSAAFGVENTFVLCEG